MSGGVDEESIRAVGQAEPPLPQRRDRRRCRSLLASRGEEQAAGLSTRHIWRSIASKCRRRARNAAPRWPSRRRHARRETRSRSIARRGSHGRRVAQAQRRRAPTPPRTWRDRRRIGVVAADVVSPGGADTRDCGRRRSRRRTPASRRRCARAAADRTRRCRCCRTRPCSVIACTPVPPAPTRTARSRRRPVKPSARYIAGAERDRMQDRHAIPAAARLGIAARVIAAPMPRLPRSGRVPTS